MYSKYSGDIDAWLKKASAYEKSLFSEGDWGLIESIVDELGISKRKMESERKVTVPSERTFTPMTEEEVENAQAETNRFKNIVDENEYEEVLNVLWKFA